MDLRRPDVAGGPVRFRSDGAAIEKRDEEIGFSWRYYGIFVGVNIRGWLSQSSGETCLVMSASFLRGFDREEFACSVGSDRDCQITCFRRIWEQKLKINKNK